MGGIFGDAKEPLLLSVRSGARASMPGMMDTVLNIGLNDETVKGLIHDENSRRFAYDSYRRFVQMYGDVVMLVRGEHHDPFEQLLQAKKDARGRQARHRADRRRPARAGGRVQGSRQARNGPATSRTIPGRSYGAPSMPSS